MKRVLDLKIAEEYNTALLPTVALIASETLGDINMIDLDTNTIAAAATTTRAAFITLCENSDGVRYLEYSEPLGSGSISSFNNTDYAPAAAKVVTIDTTALGAPSLGDIYEIFITDPNDFNYIIGRRRISYAATAADVTAGAGGVSIATGLIAAINADESEPNVIAVTTGAGTFTITGVAVAGSGNSINGFRAAHEILFDITLGENMADSATAVLTTSPDKGCGTVAEVSRMEEIHKGYNGHTNRVIYPSSSNIQYKAALHASVSGYDMYVVEHAMPFHTNTEGSVPALGTITIAIDQAATNIGTFLTQFNAMLAVLK